MRGRAGSECDILQALILVSDSQGCGFGFHLDADLNSMECIYQMLCKLGSVLLPCDFGPEQS